MQNEQSAIRLWKAYIHIVLKYDNDSKRNGKNDGSLNGSIKKKLQNILVYGTSHTINEYVKKSKESESEKK